MDIVHIVRQFHPGIGGIQRFVYDLCIHLIASGHRCKVITFNQVPAIEKDLPPQETVNGIEIFRIPFWGPDRYKMAPSVYKYFRQGQILHVHAIDFFVDFVLGTKWLHRKPVVVSTHGGYFHTQVMQKMKKIYFQTITKMQLSQADKVIACSQHDYQIFSQILNDNLLEIENGVDLNRFDNMEKKIDYGSLLFIGRLHRNKRIDWLIESMKYVKKQNPRARLQIIGLDNEGLRTGYEKMVKENGLQDRVIFLGARSDDEIKSFLQRAHFFVSASEFEGFGISTIEAMGSGTVPILNRIEPFERFVEDGKNGFLTDFTDPKKGAEAILNALNTDDSRLQAMTQQAIKKAMAYSWDIVVKKFIDVYEEAIK